MPLSPDSVLAESSANQSTPLVYENAISPTILAFVLRHIWGINGGVDIGATSSELVGEDIVTDEDGLLLPSDDIVADEDSLSLPSIESQHEEFVIEGPGGLDADVSSWDLESDEDSLMPRRPMSSMI